MSDFLVAGIDGTGSRSWRREDGQNSHVYKFVQDSPGQRDHDKRYWNGPSDTLGGDCGQILDRVEAWILARLQAVGDRQVILVGHSRGGLIAMCAAHRLTQLQRRVRFLGLYDAVDRQFNPTLHGEFIYNVEIAAHARRNSEVGSRSLFGNWGTRAVGEVDYREAFFLTSHGGVGGDPVLGCDPSNPFADCSLAGERAVPRAGGAMPVPDAQAIQGLHSSRQADEWIRHQADSAGFALPK